MQVVFEPTSIFSVFNSSTIVYVKQGNAKFCPLAPIFHLAPYLIFTATLKSIIPESLVLVTKNEQFGVKSAHIRTTIIKQLLNEVEWDMRDYQGRGLCYLPKPKAEADNTNRGLNNSSYPTRTEFNNCFIIYLYLQTFPLKKPVICTFSHLAYAA